jgi:hypothetical protein
MRYALIKPMIGVKGTPHIIFELGDGAFQVIAEEKAFSEAMKLELISRGSKNLEEATSGMSYMDVSISDVTEKNLETLEQIAARWGQTVPEDL